MTQLDPSLQLRREPMSSFQIVAVAICVALNALDGFDILAITFAGPGIMREWGLGPGGLGIVISTGLVGMSVGSLAIAPLADTRGRRPIILLCLILMTLGMLFSATANNVVALSIWRVITGLGIGGMLASINAMVAEYANDARRDFCVSLMTIGYPLGGMLGGMAAAALLAHFDWRSVFIFGGVVSIGILAVVWWRLPESIEFLVWKRSPDALNQINVIFRRMDRAPITQMPAAARRERVSVWQAFDSTLAARTVLICAAYFLYMMTCYYALGWIPSIVAALGFTPSIGAEVSVWTNLGGIIGGMLLGYLARHIGLKPLASGAMIATALALMLFGRTQPDLMLLKAVAFVLGFFLYSSAVGFYAMFVRVFPTHVRATGTGLAIGLGRFGGMLGPVLGGWLMAEGTSRPSVAAIMALGAALAGLAIWLLQGSMLAAPARPAPQGS
ncbi:MFS transporter [Steroidobacter sp. S1-65]|uniref:MFS transporter n=1 Tax=Steroidobacter gossypii TaxID=2805490 RepID=A0ABS1WYK1_9GAMM|nr:MFS transporter [Steroidobacter gossypii]MBM0106048.1 MFS transporter [Steroidobacter gossypii]